MKTTKVLTLSLPPEIVREVEVITKEEKRTKSELFREALQKYINDKRWLQIRQWGMKASKDIGVSTEEDIDKLIHQYRRAKN